jgi:hypothetical protein
MNIVGKMGASVGNALVEGLFPKKKTIVVNEHGEEIPPKPSELKLKWQTLSKKEKEGMWLALFIIVGLMLHLLGYV